MPVRKLFLFSTAIVAVLAMPLSLMAAEAREETVSEEEAPQLKFLELHGYFRSRADLLMGMDLGTYNYMAGSYTSRILPPITARVGGTLTTPATIQPMPGSTLGSVDMRLRVEPTLNVSDEIKIKAQIDCLDNVLYGTTPEAYDGFDGQLNPLYPIPAFSASQKSPHMGLNSFSDSIEVKRAWAEVMTPFGQLRFGRMPSNWGLGVLVNDGSCLDCNAGNTADRIMFATKILGHYIIPAFDFPSQGPTTKIMSESNGASVESNYQAFDADQRDDVEQWILVFMKKDKPEEIQEALRNGKMVFNYGLYNALRIQAYDFPKYYYSGAQPYEAQDLGYRNVILYIGSPWFMFRTRKFHLEIEFDIIGGKIGDALTKCADVYSAETQCFPETDYMDIRVLQYGGVIQADYKFLRDRLKVGLEFGLASGDDHPGWGTNPLLATAKTPLYPNQPNNDWKDYGYSENPFGPRQFGDYQLPDGSTVLDRTIENFRFNTDYQIDLILWKEVLGQLSDAWYIKPSISYMIAEGFSVALEIIYSQAIFVQSAPGLARPLGLEFDFHLYYRSEDGFVAGVDYGVLVPFAGMDNLGIDHLRDPSGTGVFADQAAQVGQRLRGFLAVVY